MVRVNSQLRYGIKRIATAALKALGCEVRRLKELPPRMPGIRHADVLPLATYSPWLGDEEFQNVYELIKHNTLVDQYRCYELWQLVAEAGKLVGGDLIEVGVWRGGTGALIASKCQMIGLQGEVYLCDTFRGVVKAGSRDAGYLGGEHADTSKAAVTGLCDRLNLKHVRILEGIFPEESGESLAERRFRFCHIDVDAYQSANDIVQWLWPRLLPGGIIIYDDYGFYNCAGITGFVNEERRKTDRVVIHNLNGHAIVIKVPGGAM